MDLTKNNSVLVPKQRLFAPMLGTFGGGSARGFGQGISGAGGPRLFVHSFQQRNSSAFGGEISIPSFTSSTTATALQTGGVATTEGNYPSTVADTYVHSDGKILLVTYKGSYIYLWDADDIGGTPVSSDFVGSDCRCVITASNNKIYAFLRGNSQAIYEYSVNNSYQISRDNSYARPRTNDVECAVSPPGDNFLYYADHDGYIYQCNLSGTFGHYSNASIGVTPKSMSFGANRRIFIGTNVNGLRRIDISTNGSWSNYNLASHAYGNGGAIESVVVDKNGYVHWLRNGGYLDRTDQNLSSQTNADFSARVGQPSGAQAIGDYVYVGANGFIDDAVFRYPISSPSSNDQGTSGTLLGWSNELTTDVRTDDNTARNLEENGQSFI